MSENKNKLEGYFLISETELMDPNFIRTVVLMIQHDDGGAFGLIVNRQTDLTLGGIIDVYEGTSAGDLPVFIGGPVEQQFLFVLHSGFPKAYTGDHTHEIVPGVFFEPNFQLIQEFLNDRWDALPPEDRPRIHLFGGYSGWGPGQLENELRLRSWVLLEANKGIVFHPDPAEGWNEALRKKGGIYWVVAETGTKPSMN
jgi:putative transcriptional regulator